MQKKTLFYVLALVITLAAAIYQKKTGPTYPKEITFSLENHMYSVTFPRSHGGTSNCPVNIYMPNRLVKGIYEYRRYPTQEDWTQLPMVRMNDTLTSQLPHLPPAGKLEYRLILLIEGNIHIINTEPVIIRFKGEVPTATLIPHVLFMFLAMYLSSLAGLLALFRQKGFLRIAVWTFVCLLLGGMILGPVVQKYAFGEFWTGIPFGWDLTDNKTLVAFLIWTFALVSNLKKERPTLIWMAALVILIIFSIPHSMFGSQLDPESGKIIQGIIIW